MANSSMVFHAVSNELLLGSVVFKFIAMIIGVLGNVTVITYTIFWNKEKTATSYLVGNLALADLLVCLTFYPIWITEFLQVILNIDNDQDLFCKVSRPTMWGLLFASVATLLAITIDRCLYIVKPLKYPLIVTSRRAFLIVSGIWLIACGIFILYYVHTKSYGPGFRSICYLPESIDHLIESMSGYVPLTLIIFLNYKTLSVARKQRKRIMVVAQVADINNFNEESANRMSSALKFMVALKEAKTFVIVVAVLAFCILLPTVVGQALYNFCSDSCWMIWFQVFGYEFYGINSIVNAFIYGMRHLKCRKAYGKILLKLLFCQKPAD